MAKEAVTTASGAVGVLDTSLTKSTMHVALAAVVGALIGAAVSDLTNLDILNKIKQSPSVSNVDQEELSKRLTDTLKDLENRDEIIRKLRLDLDAITPDDGVNASHVEAVRTLLDESNSSLNEVRTALEKCSESGIRKDARIAELERASNHVSELELRIRALEAELSSVIREDGITQGDVDSAIANLNEQYKRDLATIAEGWNKLLRNNKALGTTKAYLAVDSNASTIADTISSIRLSNQLNESEFRRLVNRFRDLVENINGNSALRSSATESLGPFNSSTTMDDLYTATEILSRELDLYVAPEELTVYNIPVMLEATVQKYFKAASNRESMAERTVQAFDKSGLTEIKECKFYSDGTVTYKNSANDVFVGEPLLAYCLFSVDDVGFSIANAEEISITGLDYGVVIQPKVNSALRESMHLRAMAHAYLTRAHVRPEMAVLFGFHHYYLDNDSTIVADRFNERTGYGIAQSLRQWTATITFDVAIPKSKALDKLNEALDIIWS